jgi:vacuolar-type H+-ATPase subunit I/STV1
MHIETTRDTPPTFIKRTPFTFAAQEIVEAYGIPRYLEYNPGVFTTITYPFTFAIMFGDTGHGFLLLVFALYLLFMERYWEGKKLNEFLSMAYQSSAARPPARLPARIRMLSPQPSSQLGCDATRQVSVRPATHTNAWHVSCRLQEARLV